MGLNRLTAVWKEVRDSLWFLPALLTLSGAGLAVLMIGVDAPSINDPTTAILCVDRLCELLLAFARHEPAGRVRRQGKGGGTVILPRTEFEKLTDTALDQIRHFGVGNPRFAIALLDRLAELGRLLPREHRPPVSRHAVATLRDAERRIEDERDLRAVERSAHSALAALEASGSSAA